MSCDGCKRGLRTKSNACAWVGGTPTAYRVEHYDPNTGRWEVCGDEDEPNGPECSLCGGPRGHYGECK